VKGGIESLEPRVFIAFSKDVTDGKATLLVPTEKEIVGLEKVICNSLAVTPDGHVVQLGDAAHTFLPTSGNGGTQAIEDAISLASCLDTAGRENVIWATKVHNLLRFEGVSCVQASSVVNMNKLKGRKSGNKEKKQA
jgi:2-polyprenyl-6-methoxyphenol hydroxylase-like FAD-dependent oxidoreductase